MDASVTGARHYGLDWLRIAAFALLIPYHAAMVFAPWHWVVKAEATVEALIVPMTLLTPWRLALLFAVSGFASRKLFEKSAGAGAFLISRNARLLVPLAFAMVALLPAEVWVRAVQGGYPHGLATFWLRDYWRWGTYWGVEMPSWEHLWFIVYLWGYTLALAAILGPGGLAPLQALFGRLTRGAGILWLPIAALVPAKLALMFVLPEHGGLLTDWNAHAINFPLFLLGFFIAGSERLWRDIARAWPAAAAIALLCAGVALHTELTWTGDTLPPHAWMALDRAARVACAWSMILLLFAAADRWLNRDHPWRATLAEAVFPAYIIHHIAIVLIAWWMQPAGGAAWPVEYALILGGALIACVIFYALGSRIAPLRPLIGLRPRKPAATPREPRAISPLT